MESKTPQLVIRTPEGIVFSQPLAGPVMRFAAAMIDEFILALALSLILSFLRQLAPLAPGITTFIYFLAVFVFRVFYALVLEWLWNGQTVGKRVLGLRVIDEGGMKLRFSQVALRNLMRMVDMLPFLYFVGGVACLFSARRQRLGDLAANTVVARIDEAPQPDLEQLMAGKYNSFREHAHICARLRQNTPPEVARIALQALTRRDQLDDAPRLALFEELAEALREAATFPDSATFGLTDEQYVRNAVDVLFRAGAGDRVGSRHASEPARAGN